jgi:outer membrane protein TolC
MIRLFHGAGGRSLGPPVPVVIILLLVLLGTAIPAEEAAGDPGAAPRTSPDILRISSDEAVEMAIKNNLSLESARIGVETKKRKSDLSWNVLVPSVDLGGSLIRTNKASTVDGFVPVGPIPLGSLLPGTSLPDIYGVVPYSVDVSRWHIAGSLQVALNLNYALFEGIRNTRLDYEAGLLSHDKARAQLERDVRKSYYQMLLLQENIALLRESYETAKRRVDMAGANYRSGLIPEVNLLQAQVSMENLKPTIDQAENGLRLSMASFANNLGLPYDTRFELEPVTDETDFIPLDVAELVSRAASGRPDILELKQNILLLQSTRKQTFHQLYTPTLNLAWNADPTFTKNPWKDNWFKAGDWSQSSGMFRVTLGFRLNTLFPFTTEGQGLKTLDDNLRNLNITLAQAIRGSEIEIYNTVLTLEQARNTVEAQKLTVELAERTYRLTEEAYRAGLSELLEVQNAELELRRARIGVLEQQYNYIRGLIDLEYVTGVPFGTLSAGKRS